MQRSPVARLADAVAWLESELKNLEADTRGKANELVRVGDLLAREIKNDVDLVVHQAVEDARRMVEEESRRLEEEYRRRLEEELTSIRVKAETNLDKAVRELVTEIKEILGGV